MVLRINPDFGFKKTPLIDIVVARLVAHPQCESRPSRSSSDSSPLAQRLRRISWDYYGLLWIIMDYYGLLWIIVDYYGL